MEAPPNFLHLLPRSRCHRRVGGGVPRHLGLRSCPPSCLTGLGPTCPSPGLVASTTLRKAPGTTLPSSVVQDGQVMVGVGAAPLLFRPPGARCSSTSSPDLQVGRFGRTPGWMVFHPAAVRPLGTASWALAQLKSASHPRDFHLVPFRTGTWGQTHLGLAPDTGSRTPS